MQVSPDDKLKQHLSEQGFDQEEIRKILDKVAEYDRRMERDSAFESIESGSFDLSRIIQEALE